jgi:hypothetical protein
MRVGSVTTGVLHLRSLNNLRLVGPRYAPADLYRLATPRSPAARFGSATKLTQ